MERNLAILLVLFFATHFVISVQYQNLTLIRDTCKQTPDYSLRFNTLYAAPQSRGATEVGGLATILVLRVRDKANQTPDLISGLLNDLAMGQPMKQLLGKCLYQYDTILTKWLRETTEGLSKRDNVFARDSMGAVPTYVELCERSFQGPVKSPMSDDTTKSDLASHITVDNDTEESRA